MNANAALAELWDKAHVPLSRDKSWTLPKVIEPYLKEGEEVLLVAKGDVPAFITAVVTDQQIHFFTQALGVPKNFGLSVEAVSYAQIIAVSRKQAFLVRWAVQISHPGRVSFISNLNDEISLKFVQIISERMASREKVLDSANSSPASDPFEQLTKLKELHDAGIITDQEFEAKRIRLLDAI